jgi:hypothetical protein
VDYHNALLRAQRPDAIVEDMTGWLRSVGGNARGFYEALLSIFIAHGIQFEDYDSDSTSHEAKFRETVFEPAWQATCERFGVQPMVVRLPYLRGTEYNYPVGSDWRKHGILPPEYGGEIPTCNLEPEGVIRVVHAWQQAGSRVTVEQFLAVRGDEQLTHKVYWLQEQLEREGITVAQFLDSKGDAVLKARVEALVRQLERMCSTQDHVSQQAAAGK